MDQRLKEAQEKELKEAQEILAELQQDYGATSEMDVDNILDLMQGGNSHGNIEEVYRQFRMIRGDSAFKKLKALRTLFGRCRLVKENDVLSWIDANDTAVEMEVKYRRAISFEERARRIDTQLKSTARNLGALSKHSMDDIVHVLKDHGQESDAEITGRVSTAVQSRFNIT